MNLWKRCNLFLVHREGKQFVHFRRQELEAALVRDEDVEKEDVPSNFRCWVLLLSSRIRCWRSLSCPCSLASLFAEGSIESTISRWMAEAG